MSSRYSEIDIAKGLAIILAVLGHALKMGGSPEGSGAILTSLIYSFHMPFFFIVSGFLSIKLLDDLGTAERSGYIKKRASRLLVPYLVMSILYIPLKLFMDKYALKSFELADAWKILIGRSPNTTMWFLYTLFVCSLAGAVLIRRRSLYAVWIISFAAGLIATLYKVDYRPLIYFFYFVSGIVVREHYAAILKIKKSALLIIALLFFSLASYVNIKLNINMNYPLAAISGSVLLWILARLISEAGRNASRRGSGTFLERLGDHSMDIYVLSDPIMTATRLLISNILKMSAQVSIAGCMISGLFMSYAVSMLVVRRSALLSRLLLGEGSN